MVAGRSFQPLHISSLGPLPGQFSNDNRAILGGLFEVLLMVGGAREANLRLSFEMVCSRRPKGYR